MHHLQKSVVRKIGRMKLRMIAISLVISWAMAMFVMGFYGSIMIDKSVEQYIDDSRMPDLFIELSENYDEEGLETIFESNSNVESYDLRLKVTGYYQFEGKSIPATFIGIQYPERKDINKLNLESGRYFKEEGECTIVAGMEHIDAKTGQTGNFRLSGKNITLKITGTVKTIEYMLSGTTTESAIPTNTDFVVVYLSLPDLQSYLGIGAKINDIILITDDNDRVLESLDNYSLKSVIKQSDHPSILFMDVGSDKLKTMLPVVSIIFMFIGFISIFMTVFRLILNDSRYIGVLMALGYSRKKIVHAYLFMGIVLACIGCIFGVILSLIFTRAIIAQSLSSWGNLTIIFPFDVIPFILGALYSLAIVMFSVAIPILLITRMSVKEALEFKPKIKIHISKFSLENVSRISLIGIRNTTRNPLRMIITVLVIGISIGVAGSWLVMVNSSWSYMTQQIEADTWDARADFIHPIPEEKVDLGNMETDYAITYTYLSGSISHEKNSEGVNVLGCNEIEKIRDFEVRDGNLDFSNAVITNKLADDLDVGVGDKIILEIGKKTIELKVTGIVYDVMLHTLYTKRNNLENVFNPTNCTGVYLKFSDQNDVELLRQNPMISKVAVHEEISDSMKKLLDTSIKFIYTFFIINILIAFIVSSSAVIISTMERDVEFATLKTLGIPRAQIAKSILIEIGLIGLMSSLIAVPFSYLFAGIFSKIMEKVVFYFPVIFALSATVITFVFGLLFVILSAGMPIRYSRKLDIEKTIRERTAG